MIFIACKVCKSSGRILTNPGRSVRQKYEKLKKLAIVNKMPLPQLPPKVKIPCKECIGLGIIKIQDYNNNNSSDSNNYNNN